jgi:hypothetical protein
MKIITKEKLGHYLFEVSVIFIGINLSFLFEEWRLNRREKAITQGHLYEIREETFSVQRVVNIYDSMLLAETSKMDSLFMFANPKNEDAFELIKYSLKNKDFSISYILSELSTLKSTGEAALMDRHTIALLELIQVAIDGIEKYKGNQTIHEQLIQIVFAKTTFVTDLTAPRLKTDYAKLLKTDGKLREIIAWRLTEKKSPLHNLHLIKERCESLMELVDNRLKD